MSYELRLEKGHQARVRGENGRGETVFDRSYWPISVADLLVELTNLSQPGGEIVYLRVDWAIPVPAVVMARAVAYGEVEV